MVEWVKRTDKMLRDRYPSVEMLERLEEMDGSQTETHKFIRDSEMRIADRDSRK